MDRYSDMFDIDTIWCESSAVATRTKSLHFLEYSIWKGWVLILTDQTACQIIFDHDPFFPIPPLLGLCSA